MPRILTGYFLATPKCIGVSGEVSSATQETVICQLKEIVRAYSDHRFLWCLFPGLRNEDQAIQALGEMKSEKAAELLAEFLKYDISCQSAVDALRNAPLTEKARDSLLDAALQHEDGYVRDWAKEILRRDRTPVIVSSLVKIMLDKNKRIGVRKRAIHVLHGAACIWDSTEGRTVLANLKCTEMIADTLNHIALYEECDELRKCATNALHSYSIEEIIITPLIHALYNNPNPAIRANASDALIYQPLSQVRKALIHALDDENAKVRARSAYVLAGAGIKTQEEEDDASQKLLRLFSDEDVTVRMDAIRAYGHIRRNPLVGELSQLIDLLKDESISIRYYAAEALGRLKATIALDALKRSWDNIILGFAMRRHFLKDLS